MDLAFSGESLLKMSSGYNRFEHQFPLYNDVAEAVLKSVLKVLIESQIPPEMVGGLV